MEGGGDRKRKASPLKLDWEKLLPSDDEPPPFLLVAAAPPEKSKPKPPVITGDDDDLNSDQALRKLSEKELTEKISRSKSFPLSNLSDGGVKYRARLEKLEGELERRKLLKADEKRKKDSLLADEFTFNGATDDSLQVRAPRSAPASQSTFASKFLSNMDDKGISFSPELSTLNRCDSENVRGSKQFANHRTHKMCFPSREAPFRSPSFLSVKSDNSPQSNGEQSRSRSSTPSPPFCDRDGFGRLANKENAPRIQPARNAKRYKEKTVVLLEDEEELEVDEPDQADKEDQSNKDLQITYPSRDDPRAVDILYKDMECLSPQSYLSSPIINFYILYLQKRKSTTPTGKNCNYHFFNTYFYVRLKGDVLNKIDDKETSFVKFRRWWKGVNLFEKAYIFLPIHENLHWSLVIICIPDKEDQSGPIILHLDSLKMHNSKSIFNDVKSFLVEEWKFQMREKVLPEPPFADKIWDKLSRRIEYKVLEVPQQKNEFDCGLFVLYFMERFIDEAPERLKKKDLERFDRQWFKPEDASSLRPQIRILLKDEFEKAKESICILD